MAFNYDGWIPMGNGVIGGQETDSFTLYSLQVDKRLMEKLDWVQKLMQDLAPVEQ